LIYKFQKASHQPISVAGFA